jgi:hypothetical protein
MKQYPFVEDYIEYLAGYDLSAGIGMIITPLHNQISLARYDVAIVNSMANHTAYGGALTDKQATLAVKIVLKYRRQFAKCGIDVGPVEQPVFRLPIRKVDRSKRIWIEDNSIAIRFPYDNVLIKELQNYKSESIGTAKWNKESKTWYLGLTEYNVNWAVTWGDTFHFEVDSDLRQMYGRILQTEAEPYEIKLIRKDNVYTITNAADSLIEYINDKLGGFALSNTVKLVDYAGVLGYRLGIDTLEYPEYLSSIGEQQTIYLKSNQDTLEDIFSYAELTNRYPVCIYNPPGGPDIDLSRFNEQDVVRFDHNGKTSTCDYDPHNVKVVYASKIPKTWDSPVPLLISTVEMLYGGKRMEWLNTAERVVFYCGSSLKGTN